MRRRRVVGAAVVGTAAYQAGKHREQGREREEYQQAQIDDLQAQVDAQQAQPAAPPPAPGATSGMDDKVKALQDLGNLHQQGILSDEEFAEQKRRILNS
jgi:hypothetical protein